MLVAVSGQFQKDICMNGMITELLRLVYRNFQENSPGRDYFGGI